MHNPFEGKKAKFVKGQIVLRSEKSGRNYEKALNNKKEKYGTSRLSHGDHSPFTKKEARSHRASEHRFHKEHKDLHE